MNEHDLDTRQRRRSSSVSRKTLIGALVILGMLTIGVSDAHAQGTLRGYGNNGGQGIGPQIAAALDLTRSQQYRIRALREVMRRDLANEQQQLRSLQTQIRRARSVSNPSEAHIARLNYRINAVRQVIHQRHLRFQADVMRTLTPEQRRRLRVLRQNNIRRAASNGHVMPNGARSPQMSHLGPATYTGRLVPNQLQLGPQLLRIEPVQWNISPIMPTNAPINAQ